MSFQVSYKEGMAQRRIFLEKSRKVVVKVGSAVLTENSGLDRHAMENLARQLADLRNTGREVILVSSGAVAAGRRKMGVGGDIGLREKQALAAIGQSHLMRSYEDIFAGFGQKVAQVLLTHDDLAHRDRYLNIRNTIFTLLHWGIIPIINENDTVSVEELRFGDNDSLGAMVTNLIEADLFICLTDVEGLFTANPLTDNSAHKVSTVAKVTRKVEDMAGNVKSKLGTGGMRSKIIAAKMVSARGGCSFIGSGRSADIIAQLFANQNVGTFFLPQKEKLQSRKHWIAYTLRPKGFLVLDKGACRALKSGGRSLLPSGIVEVRGKFGVGAPVHCLDQKDKPVAAGLVNYRSVEIEKIQGKHSREIKDILGYADSEEVVHRDNLVIL